MDCKRSISAESILNCELEYSMCITTQLLYVRQLRHDKHSLHSYSLFICSRNNQINFKFECKISVLLSFFAPVISYEMQFIDDFSYLKLRINVLLHFRQIVCTDRYV